MWVNETHRNAVKWIARRSAVTWLMLQYRPVRLRFQKRSPASTANIHIYRRCFFFWSLSKIRDITLCSWISSPTHKTHLYPAILYCDGTICCCAHKAVFHPAPIVLPFCLLPESLWKQVASETTVEKPIRWYLRRAEFQNIFDNLRQDLGFSMEIWTKSKF